MCLMAAHKAFKSWQTRALAASYYTAVVLLTSFKNYLTVLLWDQAYWGLLPLEGVF